MEAAAWLWPPVCERLLPSLREAGQLMGNLLTSQGTGHRHAVSVIRAEMMPLLPGLRLIPARLRESKDLGVCFTITKRYIMPSKADVRAMRSPSLSVTSRLSLRLAV